MSRRYFVAAAKAALTAMTLAVGIAQANAADIGKEIQSNVDALRSFKPPESGAALDRFSENLDKAWRLYEANSAEAIPILRSQLTAELARPQPNSLILLDLGFFLAGHDEASLSLARDALMKIDVKDPGIVVSANSLFYFTHRLAPKRDLGMLDWIDKAFLRNRVTVVVPQHAMTLSADSTCIFLYGLYGEGAEAHLLPLLNDPAVRLSVLRVLFVMGTPDSVPAITSTLSPEQPVAEFEEALGNLVGNGGPRGREVILALDPAHYPEQHRTILERSREFMASISYEKLKARFEPSDGAPKLSETELLARLEAMRNNYGIDDTLSAQAILSSSLPPETLIKQLEAIRTVTFNRVSDEAMHDVAMTNALLMALRYRH